MDKVAFPPNLNYTELLHASSVCCGRCRAWDGDEEGLGSISSPATNWLSSGYSSAVGSLLSHLENWHNDIYLIRKHVMIFS